jgi:hypothetical protein
MSPCILASDLAAPAQAAVPLPETSLAKMSQAAFERPHTYYLRTAQQQAAYNAWKISAVAVASSQVLDVASSYHMREMNPLLANSTGQFGARAAGIKLGVTSAILAAQYWRLRTHPERARRMTILNWAAAALTTSFAAHNFAIR